MLREIAENAASKAKEDIELPLGIAVLIAVASFIIGLTVGILCASGSKARDKKIRKSSFNAEDYAEDLNFDGEEEPEEAYEYSF